MHKPITNTSPSGGTTFLHTEYVSSTFLSADYKHSSIRMDQKVHSHDDTEWRERYPRSMMM